MNHPSSPTHPDQAPSIFGFLDVRDYLRQAYAAEKRRNAVFSHRYIAREMGSRSPAFFNDILNGRQQLNLTQARGFVRLFRLGRKDAEHFEDMVLYAQAKTEKDKAYYLDKLTAQSAAGGYATLELFQMEYFKKWYYAGVRELLGIYDFRGNYEELASLLDPAVTPGEALDAIQVLLRLKLIKKVAHGRYERLARVVGSVDAAKAEWIRPAIQGNLDLAQRAFQIHPPAIRPFSYLTISVSESAIAHIDREMDLLRERILKLVTQDKGVDRIYQMNLQLFPLSGVVQRKPRSR